MTNRRYSTIAPSADVPVEFDHGDGCVVGPMSFIAEGCTFEHDVLVGARATIMPPPAMHGDRSAMLLVRSGVQIGAGAVICGASVIERGARIEAGAVVTRDIPPYAIVAGNPAYVVGYVSPPATSGESGAVEQVRIPAEPGVAELIGGATIIRFPEVIDLRGSLTFGEAGDLLPFEVKRFFCVYNVPSRSVRGEHSHRTLHELLIAASGSVRVSLTNGHQRCEVVLEEPSVGLYLPPRLWSTQYSHSETSVIVVLCSHVYDPSSYVRTYDEYLALIR